MTCIQAEPLTQEELEFFHNSEFFAYKWTHLFVFRTAIWERILDHQSRASQRLREPNHIMHPICDDHVMVWFKFQRVDGQNEGFKVMPIHIMSRADLIVEFEDGIFGPVKYLKDRANPCREIDLKPIQVRERFRQELMAITRLR